jgi:hypothetical protein
MAITMILGEIWTTTLYRLVRDYMKEIRLDSTFSRLKITDIVRIEFRQLLLR